MISFSSKIDLVLYVFSFFLCNVSSPTGLQVQVGVFYQLTSQTYSKNSIEGFEFYHVTNNFFGLQELQQEINRFQYHLEEAAREPTKV